MFDPRVIRLGPFMRPIRSGLPLTLLLLLAICASASAQAPLYYVKHDATGANDGSSWDDAYTDLQLALERTIPTYGLTFWIARGTYRPSISDRSAKFRALEGVTLIGGFAGDESDLSQRDLAANHTILSGDLNADDGPGFANFDDNSESVVFSLFATLQDLTITGSTSVALTTASYGSATPPPPVSHLTNCIFIDNRGVALRATDAPSVSRCRFLRTGGPAIDFDGMITHRYGASTLGVHNCLFQSCGILESVPALRARVQGIFDSCLFVDNPAGVGVSMATATRAAPYGLKIKNSILWRNGPVPISGSGIVELSDCLVENLAQVLAPNRLVADNFEADPLFVDSLGPDGGPGTLDEDFHLAAGSPCIDRGSPFGRTTDLNGPVAETHCRADLGVFESPFFVDCDANGLSDACELNADATLDQNRDRKLDRCEPGADDGADPNDPGKDGDGRPSPTGCAPLSFPLLAMIASGLALFRRSAASESDGRCA